MLINYLYKKKPINMGYKLLEKLGKIFLSATINTKDGQPLFISDLEENGKVEIMIDGEKMDIPDGTWELENDKTIKTVDGIIVDIFDTVVEEEVNEEETETVVEEVEAKIEEEVTEEVTEDVEVEATETVEEVKEIVDEIVEQVETKEEVDVELIKTLEDKIAELEDKILKLVETVETKDTELAMQSEKLENTKGTKKDTKFDIKSTISDADKDKYWYKKLHGLV